VPRVKNFDLYKHLYIHVYDSIWYLLTFNLNYIVKKHLELISLSFEVLCGVLYIIYTGMYCRGPRRAYVNPLLIFA
jgi:hypothetical protein